MRYFDLVAAESRHFIRSKYKLLALLIFAMTCSYSLYRGISFYDARQKEIDKIEIQKKEAVKEANDWLENGVAGPEGRSWVNINDPFWAMWYASHHVYDGYNPMLVYSTGQADQFAFYKRVSMWTSGYDPDLVADLHNPEFVGIGSLDFTFSWIFLLPVLLIILLHDIKGLEYDLGFQKSVLLHVSSESRWLFYRMSFYLCVTIIMLLVFTLLPRVWVAPAITSLSQFLLICFGYTLVWFVICFFVIRYGKGRTDQAMKMLTIWLLVAVILPGASHQYLNFKYPPNYMMDWLTTKRVEQDEIFERSYAEVLEKVKPHYSWLQGEELLLKDSISQDAQNSIYRLALAMEFTTVVNGIFDDLEDKNQAIQKMYWISPLTYCQNILNSLCGTDYYANRRFRDAIQSLGLKINERILQDELNEVKVDAARFLQYQEIN